MIAIQASSLSLSFGDTVILKDVTFAAQDGEHIGIVGTNGAGKTSLFRLLSGVYTPDSGTVSLQKGHTLGVLEQNADLTALPGDMTMEQYMITAFPALLALEEQIEAVTHALTVASTEEIETLSARLAALNQRFADEGGLEFRSRARGMLLRLGFTEAQLTQTISTLSGGQYTRLALARLLATEPDVLMLDEPTNHLDLDALAWLEGFLAGYKKTVLIISHDRYFLDRTTEKTMQIQDGTAKLFHGNYSAAKLQMEAERASLEKRYKEQQKEIERIRKNIEFQRRCNREHNFVTIRSKEKQLARMEKIEKPKGPEKEIRVRFLSESESTGHVIEARDLSFSYGGKALIENLSFLIEKGERVLFLGPNGSGKSTLMKLINGLIVPQGGCVECGYNIKIGYYDQENRGLSESNTVFSEMRESYPLLTDLELRSALALFLFGAEDMDKSVRVLSGGERARLTLAKLILKKVNLLVMDEPTNHLDIGSAEALENALLAFDGTVVAVSHDRYFINRIATRIVELAPGTDRGMLDYRLEEYDDAYTEYLRLKEKKESLTRSAAPTEASAGKEEYEQKKREAAKKRGEQKKLERAAERVTLLEKELEALEEELFGEAASDYVRAAEIDRRKGEIEEELLSLYELLM